MIIDETQLKMALGDIILIVTSRYLFINDTIKSNIAFGEDSKDLLKIYSLIRKISNLSGCK